MKSRVVRAAGAAIAAWPERPLREYKNQPELYRDVTRCLLLGGSDEPESALTFELRYFEVAAGGYSTLERHQHPHAVLVLRGQGEVRLGGASHEIAPFDVVYVAPNEPHQFRASRGEALGFLCVVDRERDRPIALSVE